MATTTQRVSGFFVQKACADRGETGPRPRTEGRKRQGGSLRSPERPTDVAGDADWASRRTLQVRAPRSAQS